MGRQLGHQNGRAHELHAAKGRPNIKKVYLINQDYSFGQSVRKQAAPCWRRSARTSRSLATNCILCSRSRIFPRYVAKIKASGADTVITGNWGQDIALLLKAAADAGLQTDWYTYYAGGAPVVRPRSSRPGLSHRVFEIVEAIPNSNPAATQKWEADFRAKTGVGLFYPRAVNEMRMLAKAVNAAKSDDPKAIAPVLEGMKTEGFDGRRRYDAQG